MRTIVFFGIAFDLGEVGYFKDFHIRLTSAKIIMYDFFLEISSFCLIGILNI